MIRGPGLLSHYGHNHFGKHLRSLTTALLRTWTFIVHQIDVVVRCHEDWRTLLGQSPPDLELWLQVNRAKIILGDYCHDVLGPSSMVMHRALWLGRL